MYKQVQGHRIVFPLTTVQFGPDSHTHNSYPDCLPGFAPESSGQQMFSSGLLQYRGDAHLYTEQRNTF